MYIEVHEKFTHDPSCDNWDWSGFDEAKVFVSGAEYNVPDEAAEYFIRAGWACVPGEEPVKPDSTKPVLVQPDSASHSHAGKGAK